MPHQKPYTKAAPDAPLTDFAKDVVSELSSPLAAVSTNLEYLRERFAELPPEDRLLFADLFAALGDAQEGAERMAQTLQAIRAAASGSLSTRPERASSIIELKKTVPDSVALASRSSRR